MNRLRIPRERLPSDAAVRHNMLRTYFCDKDADAQLVGGEWNLRLFWPDNEERYVDPQLDIGLAWWGEGVSRETMATARRRQGRILSALYDTWTLHSWTEWLVRRRISPDTEIRILHVDDHCDLMSPRLFIQDCNWRDLITDDFCDLRAPQTVQAAIESGAVGMGSFLTPFLHCFPRAEVRHLCQPPKSSATVDFSIRTTAEPDNLLELGSLRPAIELEQAPGRVGPGNYRQTPDFHDWLDDLGPGPVLLHIDMDYFNNRFDGDSDWALANDRLDPDIGGVLARVDTMVAALTGTGVIERLEDIVIAYSPGFFPAELWAPAGERLQAHFERLHG